MAANEDKTAIGKLLQKAWNAIKDLINSIRIEVIRDQDKQGVQIHIYIDGSKVTKKPVTQKEAAAILAAIDKGKVNDIRQNKNLRKRAYIAARARKSEKAQS